MSTVPLPKMMFGLVEDRTGHRAVKRRDVMSPRSVPDDVSTLPALEAATPSAYRDQHGQVGEYTRDFIGPEGG
ncbi:hypothetical protein [Streptomyces sp. NPDC048489]|uniref:hypothetical protein n=1 Tax=Streptomyces sp. NPDC048489 TaxID=3154504 RepID=UPI0034495DB2